MEQHQVFALIIVILIGNFLFERFLEILNTKASKADLPLEAEGIYDSEKYKKSQEYGAVNTRFGWLTSSYSFLLILCMLYFDGFAYLDSYIRTITEHPILMALVFFGILTAVSSILTMPFSLYSTFVIEEKFGFNKTTWKTYVFDKLKGILLGAVIGGGLLSVIVWFFEFTGEYFWLYTWGLMTLFMVFITMFYSSLILPLFNKLTPLDQGELRSQIETYCEMVGFKLDNLFVMDGSKRSSKANAFFSGLGSKKKIVLYDTLIENHSNEELVAILAHEVGHYKHKHTRLSMVIGVLQTGLTLYLLSLIMNYSGLGIVLGVEQTSFHIGILVFGMLYGPISMIMGIAMSMLSRKNEYEADDFARKTYKSEHLITALKKLSSDNLSNLTPHPWYVFIHYSYPTVLDRIKKLSQ